MSISINPGPTGIAARKRHRRTKAKDLKVLHFSAKAIQRETVTATTVVMVIRSGTCTKAAL